MSMTSFYPYGSVKAKGALRRFSHHVIPCLRQALAESLKTWMCVLYQRYMRLTQSKNDARTTEINLKHSHPAYRDITEQPAQLSTKAA